jgi:hypothetical protein
MRPSSIVAAFATLLACLAWALPAHPHGMRSAYLGITEDAPGAATVQLRVAMREAVITPRFPASCTLARVGGAVTTDAGEVRTWTARCEGPLAGSAVALDGLGGSVTDGVVWASLADGRVVSHVVSSSSPSWTIPAPGGDGVGREYVRLGVEHIATGADHLIFLVLLVLAVRRLRAVLVAETFFTLSHCATLAATSLGLLRVPAQAAEACIALSLVFVAVAVVRGDAMPPRSAAITAFVFGGVHGLGFAGGLREIGFPEEHVVRALCGFAAGIEVGQVLVVLATLALVSGLERLGAQGRARLGLAYAAGGLACFWFFERLTLCLGWS